MKKTVMQSLWVSTGEVSGDLHASHVVRELLAFDASIQVRGIGGEFLAKSGMECTFSIEKLSVMGVADVLKKFFTILSLLRSIRNDFIANPPDAVLLVDAPSFNFRVAKIAHTLGIPVYYYICPKVWASRPKRVYFLKKYCKKIFCIFPFEVEWLQNYGVIAEYVGNPLVEYVQESATKNYRRFADYITILPGSRKSEIQELLPLFVETLLLLQKKHHSVKFFCIRAPNISAEFLESYFPPELSIYIIEPEQRYDIIAQSWLALVASGTATLETALLGTPSIVSYKMGAITAWLMKQFMTVSRVSLPNIILDDDIFPEFLQENATIENIYTCAERLLPIDGDRVAMVERLEELQTILGCEYSPAKTVAKQLCRGE